MEKRRINVNPLYEFCETEESTKSKVVGQLVRTRNPMKNTQKLENAGVSRVI
jgi:pilus assembly protein CpaF